MLDRQKIKINFCGFWSSFKKENNMLYNILSKRYNVEISENPDYVFVSPLGKAYDFMKYDCIRIFYSGEEIVPDFNLFDYAIGFDDIHFGDRYYRYPLCFWGDHSYWKYDQLSISEAKELLSKKDIFCNLIYNEDSIDGFRQKLFEALNKYKHVGSFGRFLNNVNGNGISYSEKLRILKCSKFTIAVEGCNYPGIATEKITQPFEEHSIPIFYGNPDIIKDFNQDSFINCHDYSSIDDVVKRIIEIDNDDDLYLDMLTSQPLVGVDYAEELYKGLEKFLYSIFDQPKEDCNRRVDSVISRNNNKNANYMRKLINNRFVQKWFDVFK